MNKERWAHLKDLRSPPGAMDWRHVEMIHAVLMHELPLSVVEIGCYNGFSTSALIEALEQTDKIESADLVEVNVRPLLRALVASADKRVTLHEKASADYEGTPEMWMIDGDHEEGAIIDYGKARKCARIIVIHDSNSEFCIGQHSGATSIANLLRAECPWTWEDKAKREGELTERGLIFGFFTGPKPETIAALNQLAQ